MKTNDGLANWQPLGLVVMASLVEQHLQIDQAWTNRQVQKQHHIMTKSPSFLSLLPPPPPPPHPQIQTHPTLTSQRLPPAPTTSIPIPSCAYRASHSTCFPSDITWWLKLLAAPEYGVQPVATESTESNYFCMLYVSTSTTGCRARLTRHHY